MIPAGILIIYALLSPAVAAPTPAWHASPPAQAQPQAEPTQSAPPPSQDNSKPSGQETKPQSQPEPAPVAPPPQAQDSSKPAEQPPTETKESKPDQSTTLPPPSPPSSSELQGTPGNAPAAAPETTASPASSTQAKKSRKRKPGPSRKIVRKGGTSDVAVDLSPSMSQQQASNQKQSADQLIASTDENLKKIAARPLQPNEQETVNQIHNYLDQARAALKSGDLERSRNLAFKAHLLSVELLPH